MELRMRVVAVIWQERYAYAVYVKRREAQIVPSVKVTHETEEGCGMKHKC